MKERYRLLPSMQEVKLMQTGHLSQGRNVVTITLSSVIHHKRKVISKLKNLSFPIFHKSLHKLHLFTSPFSYILIDFRYLL